MPAVFPGFRRHCCALHPWEPSICRRAGRAPFPRQCWNEDLLDEPQSSLFQMSQEELSGSVSQLEVSLSSYYNSRVISAAERRCYCELWQTHWVLQQHKQTKGNEFREDAWGMLSQFLPLPLALHHSLSLAPRHEGRVGIEDTCTRKHVFYLCSQGYGHGEVLFFSEEYRILSWLELKDGTRGSNSIFLNSSESNINRRVKSPAFCSRSAH